MQLKDVLAVSRVEVDPPLSAKKRLLEHIAHLCAPTDVENDFFEALLEREKLGSTSLGHGVALPHARVHHLSEPIAVFIRLKESIPYDSHDDENVDLVFGLFVPHNEESLHLNLLSEVAALLNQSAIRKSLRDAKTSQDIWDMLIHAP